MYISMLIIKYQFEDKRVTDLTIYRFLRQLHSRNTFSLSRLYVFKK